MQSVVGVSSFSSSVSGCLWERIVITDTSTSKCPSFRGLASESSRIIISALEQLEKTSLVYSRVDFQVVEVVAVLVEQNLTSSRDRQSTRYCTCMCIYLGRRSVSF